MADDAAKGPAGEGAPRDRRELPAWSRDGMATGDDMVGFIIVGGWFGLRPAEEPDPSDGPGEDGGPADNSTGSRRAE